MSSPRGPPPGQLHRRLYNMYKDNQTFYYYCAFLTLLHMGLKYFALHFQAI